MRERAQRESVELRNVNTEAECDGLPKFGKVCHLVCTHVKAGCWS